MFVLCLLYKDGSMERKVTWRTKGLKRYKNGSKGKTPDRQKKKKSNRTGGMDVCVVFVVRTVAWNVKWHEGRKDWNSTKMDQREKPRTGKKKSRLGHGCVSLVSVVWCQVEVSATSWSPVQRSPTECGVSKQCVIVKPQKMRRPRSPRGCRAIEKAKDGGEWSSPLSGSHGPPPGAFRSGRQK
jgi:hypothetical protein